MKILIVDDSMLCRKMVKAYMKEALPSAQYITAANGIEGLQLYESEAPDFLILDLLMPGMNGLEMLSNIKAQNPAVKAMVLTADVQKSTREEVEQIGVLKIFSKPFTREHAAEIADLITD